MGKNKRLYLAAKQMIQTYELRQAIKAHRKNIPTQADINRKAKEIEIYAAEQQVISEHYKQLSEEDKKLYGVIEHNLIMWEKNASTAGSVTRKILKDLGKWKI